MWSISTLYTVQGYYSAVTYVDWLVGRLVAAVDSVAGEQTVVVLTSDHGWALGQHAEWTKMSNYEARAGISIDIYSYIPYQYLLLLISTAPYILMCWQEVVRVPLIVVAPGVPGGQVVPSYFTPYIIPLDTAGGLPLRVPGGPPPEVSTITCTL